MDKKIIDKKVREVAAALIPRIRAGRYADADELDADLLVLMREHGFAWRTRTQQLDLIRHAPLRCVRDAEEYAEGLEQIARETTAIFVLGFVRRAGIDPEMPARKQALAP